MDEDLVEFVVLPCLSVKQPMATWLVSGHKTLELRSWEPKYQRKGYVGPIVIVSSLKPQLEGLRVGSLEGVVMLDGFKVFEEGDREAAVTTGHPDGRILAWQMSSPLVFNEDWTIKGMLGIYESHIPKHLVEDYLVVHGYKFYPVEDEDGIYRVKRFGR